MCIRDRDTLAEAFAALRKGDMLLAVSLAVLAPDRPAVYDMAARLMATGACLATIEEGIDTDSRNGRSFLRLMKAMQRLEANPEPVDPPEPAPVPPGPGIHEYVPDWDEPEPDGHVPSEMQERPPVHAAIERPRGAPAWIPQAAARPAAAPREHVPMRPAWIPTEPTAKLAFRPATAQTAVSKQPYWMPAATTRKTDYGPGINPFALDAAPDWHPGQTYRPDRAGPEPLAQPDWLPVPVTKTDCACRQAWPATPAWVPDIPDREPIRYKKITRLYDIDRGDWMPVPPFDLPQVPKRRILPMPDPPGEEAPMCPDPDRIGILPPDAKLKPGTRAMTENGTELIVIPTRPGAEKAIGEGVTDVTRTARERPPTAAERLVVSQMREQRRMAGIRHAVIAAVIALLILLGILAATLPRLNAGPGVLGEAPPAAIANIPETEPVPSGQIPKY